jgi:hypothetical protein
LGVGEDGSISSATVELLVTEHWDARCLNNGLFYVRATSRPLIFFTTFLTQLYANPYTDNQNLFDAFLAHSTLDTAAPEMRPLLRYALLDLEKRFACAEGHMGNLEDLVTFHFWSSDSKTREVTKAEGDTSVDVADGGKERGKIRTRDGVERVEKVLSSKSELFHLFYGNISAMDSTEIPGEAGQFVARVRTPTPNWKGMCSVTAVGIEDLVDERMLQNNVPLVDWNKATEVAGVPGSSGSKVLDQSSATSSSGIANPTAVEGETPSMPYCAGAPVQDWVDAMRRIAELEDTSRLRVSAASALKSRLRRMDVGTLMVIKAYGDYGAERLSKELTAILVEAT